MFKDKTAIVTGASRGIGKAIALHLSSLGANIVINYNNSSAASEDLVKLIKSNGGNALAVKADVSDFDQSKELIDICVKTFGSIDYLINNAGITKDQLLIRMKEDDFDRVIDINLKGTFNCTKHASKYMMKQRYGKIINVSSIVGQIGNVGQSNYAASKAGIIGFTKAIAKELAPRQINVNAIAPGFVVSDMTDKLSESIKSDLLSKIPMKTLGQPEDIAKLVAFLVSDNAKYITGQVINIDGGMVM